MSTTHPRIPSIILPDDGGAGGDDDVDVTAHVANPHILLGNHVGIPHVANKASLPATDLYTGRLCQTDDLGVIYQYIAGTGWRLLCDTQWQTWNSTWTAATSSPVIGNGTLLSRYFRHGKKADIKFDLEFGSTTSGGQNTWHFTGPGGWSLTREHKQACTIFASQIGSDVPGMFIMAAAGGIDFYSVITQNDNRMNPVRNTDAGGGTGTSIPLVAGQFAFQTNSNLRGTLTVEVTQGTYDTW